MRAFIWATWACLRDLGEPRKAIEFYEQALAIAERSATEGAKELPGQPGHRLRRPGRAPQGHRVLRAGPGHRPRDRRPEGRRNTTWATWAMPTPTWASPARPSSIYEQALAIAREIGDRRGEGADLGNLGLAYADLGEPRKAIEFYEQALAIAREIGDRRGEGAWPGQPGHCLRRPGRAPQGHRVSTSSSSGHRPRDRRPKG